MPVVLTAIVIVFIVAWFVCFACQSGVTASNAKLKLFVTEKRVYQGEGVNRKDIICRFPFCMEQMGCTTLYRYSK